MPRGSCWPPLWQTGEDNWVVPASHGSAVHHPTGSETSPSYAPPKQQIWLRTALCGGWFRRMALSNRELHARNDDDDDASMMTHISRTAASCFGILCQLWSIHRSLPRHAVVSLITSLVLAKLNYCNSLLVGLPAKLLNRLQAVINTAARLVCHAMKADHITPVLKDLHWLWIQARIQYKLCVLAFKCQYSAAPPYLSVSDQLQQVARMEPRQCVRSSSSPALVIPATRRQSLGDWAFLVAAARVWNSLPSTVTAASTLHSFYRSRKTHLFTASFPRS